MKDLDWIARNVHEWPTECTNEPVCVHRRWIGDEVISIAKLPSVDGDYTDYYTRTQWQTRRAELQNKPKVEDWPEWAEWLAQCSDGEWRWFEDEPYQNNSVWSPIINGTWTWIVPRGLVLGDWRNTLERRPEDESGHMCPYASKENCKTACGDCEYNKVESVSPLDFGAGSESEAEAYCRKWDEIDPQQSKWTGPEDGLPPVGTEFECLWSSTLGTYSVCKFIGIADNGDIVFELIETPDGSRIGEIDRIMPDDFNITYDGHFNTRPLRTEEEKAVEQWCKDIEKSIEKYNVNIDCSAAIKATIVESVRIGYRKLDKPDASD